MLRSSCRWARCALPTLRLLFQRHCEPTGRANARPMTGSAKQSISYSEGSIESSSLPSFTQTFRVQAMTRKTNSKFQTAAATASRSRRGFRARFGPFVPPSSSEGAGNAGRPMRPIAACAEVVELSTRVSQVTPESPGIPRAMVLTGSFALSPATGLSCHRRPRKLLPANLTPASGRQDHTTSPSAR
jgi:hypothetical protein